MRDKAPRSSHAEWAPDRERPDPISLLEQANETRLENLVPIRYGRMSMSPFAFYRGSADILANDLAKTPVSGIQAQLCGDAHLSNFGAFALPERRLVFDVNDFDETLTGPWEWDVKRLAASVILASRENGYSAQESRLAVLSCLRYYREYMQRLAQMGPHLDVWYYKYGYNIPSLHGGQPAGQQTDPKEREGASRRKLKDARAFRCFRNWPRRWMGGPGMKDDPPLIYHYDPLHPNVDDLETDEWYGLVKEYLWNLREEVRVIVMSYRAVDVAQKVVGVGSVGTRCAIVLALGGAEGDDPLFIQIKEASASVLEPYVGASPYPHHGQRVVIGQHMMQAQSDIFLGWSTFDGKHYYGRQLRDMKFSVEVENINLKRFTAYVNVCGATLARAHARTSDPAQISGYLGNNDTFDQAIASFAEVYADQAERDHAALLAAMKDGRVQAEVGM